LKDIISEGKREDSGCKSDDEGTGGGCWVNLPLFTTSKHSLQRGVAAFYGGSYLCAESNLSGVGRELQGLREWFIL